MAKQPTRPNADIMLRTDLGPFRAVWRGDKTAELRKNDRQFQVNDVIELIEFDKERGMHINPYRSIFIRVTHIQESYGIEDGHVMLSFKVIQKRIGLPRPCVNCGKNSRVYDNR